MVEYEVILRDALPQAGESLAEIPFGDRLLAIFLQHCDLL
jgi:hypothetical protein